MVTGATGGSSNRPDTFFAPAGRDSLEGVQSKRDTVNRDETLRAMLDAMPSWVFVLNQQRQVVTANSALLNLVNRDEDDVIGSRPGEIIGCVHAAHGPDGCGTAMPCIDCGAVRTVLQSQNTGETITGECRLRTGSSLSGALELRVTATPVEIGSEQLVLVALEDVGDRSRLAVLTRVFFHDVMNTIVGLKTHFQVIANKAAKGPIDPAEIGGLEKYLDELSDEIRSQRELMLAEAGDLKVSLSEFQTTAFSRDLVDLFSGEEGECAEIVLGEVWDGELVTDRSLLTRVMGNMLRNALEATSPERKVTLSCRDCGEAVRLSVHNEESMADDVQRQVFLRSFSTKAATGRGIGTHSMKLIGERYLLGRVGFDCVDGEGTTFWIELSKQYSA
jgi:Histidine kinase-, DNA gyrase B-, and HSP90-like ATPase/PAS domain